MSGYSPEVSVEFGRQAIPVREKPTYAKLYGECRNLKNRGYEGTGWRRIEADMEAAVKRFMESLGDTQ